MKYEIESPELICTRQCKSSSKKADEKKCQDQCLEDLLKEDPDDLNDLDNLNEKDRQDLDKYLKCLGDHDNDFDYCFTLFKGQSSSDYLF